MAGFFQRVFSLGEAEAHSIIDKLEDPVKMTEQGIRELKSELQKALESFAQIKAAQIRAQSNLEKNKNDAGDWERKAMLLVQQGQAGKLPADEADRLATEAITRKGECLNKFQMAKKDCDIQTNAVNGMQKNIEKLKNQVQQYENELITLKARAKTADATKKINQQLSNVDSKGTLDMLERMKQKVEVEESLALAYGDMANINQTVEDEINKALLTDNMESQSAQSTELAALKAKMGIK